MSQNTTHEDPDDEMHNDLYSGWSSTHDYDPRWDYSDELRPHWQKHPLVQQAQTRLDSHGAQGRVYAADLDHRGVVGIYINGTGVDEPVILVDPYGHEHGTMSPEEASQQMDRTIDHEYRHAQQDSEQGPEGPDYDEDDAEGWTPRITHSFHVDIPSTEDVLAAVLASSLPPVPPQEQHYASALIQWWETDPGEVYIHAEGGTADDRHYGSTLVAMELQVHGYRRAKFDLDVEHLDSGRRTSSWPDPPFDILRFMANDKEDDPVERWVSQGKVLPFAQHDPASQRAIAHYMAIDGEAWPYPEQGLEQELPNYIAQYGQTPIGITQVPVQELYDAIAAHPDHGPDWQRWYEETEPSFDTDEKRGVPEGSTEIWPVILDREHGEPLQDGWHRAHHYMKHGVDPIPAVFYP